MLTSLAVAPIGAEAQQTAVVRGTVRDAATGQALEDARVGAQGSAHTVATDAAGRYTLTGIAAGQVVVRVQRFGYRAAADTLTLAPGDSVAADFALRPSALHMKPVVVTAGKRSQLLDQVVTSVALVQDSELARRAVNTVDEAVDKAPGVQFLNGQVNIRGSTGYVQGLGARVLLLVDGVPANQGDRGGINWDMLPVDQVERVEIVKGAGSALYGSAALGGVVNLITRDIPTGLHARVRTTGGYYANPPDTIWRFRDYIGAQEGLDVTGSYGGDAVRASLTAGGRHSDGYREQDRSDYWDVVGKGEWLPSATSHLHLIGSWASNQYQAPLLWCEHGQCDDRGQSYQPFMIDRSQAGAHTRSDKGLFAATLEHTVSPRESWLARGSWLRTDFTDFRSPTTDFGVANRYGAEMRGLVRPTAGRVVTVGAEGALSDVTSNIFHDHGQDEFAAYAESEQRLGSARMTAGARVDYIAVDGGGLSAVVSPRVGLVLPGAGGTLFWRVSAGRGFRAPSLAEQFVETALGPFTVAPNPNLRPETAWSLEVGNAAQFGTMVRTDAALFWTEASDLIEPTIQLTVDPATGATTQQIQFQNLQRARLAGLDVALYAFPFTPHLSTSLAYTLLYTREFAHDTVPAQPLAFRPRHLLTLAADYAWGGFNLGADFRYTSRFERVELYPPTDPQVAPKVLDLRAGYQRDALSVRLLVANALNYLYNLAPQTLAPVRTVTMTLTWTY
ncbi:MAG: hypothetical protein DMD49_08105 [Gemmatimonadetes bacterium]|nr:MAG: hypothetical protein DMD49_08105 [Gemmatimonadota bacterium]